jgi:hypothetical protein
MAARWASARLISDLEVLQDIAWWT